MNRVMSFLTMAQKLLVVVAFLVIFDQTGVFKSLSQSYASAASEKDAVRMAMLCLAPIILFMLLEIVIHALKRQPAPQIIRHGGGGGKGGGGGGE